MNLEQRLYHAARELREVEIVVPPLGTSALQTRGRPRPLRVLQALAAPALFVAGGLFAVGALDTVTAGAAYSDIQSASAVSSPAPTAPPAAVRTTSDAPSVLAELQMIAEIVNNNRRVNEAQPAPPTQLDDAAEPGSTLGAADFGPL